MAVDAVRLWLESGAWTEEAYFALPETNHIVELSDGILVIPDMPTLAHQRLTGAFFLCLTAWNQEHHAGEAVVAPYPVRLWPSKVREPDVVFYLAEHVDRLRQQNGGPPDLVLEVLSPGTRQTDLKEKLAEYARAEVAEYWIGDPEARWIEVHTLQSGRYRKLGRFRPAEHASSKLLPGFSVPVAELFHVPAEGGAPAARRIRRRS